MLPPISGSSLGSYFKGLYVRRRPLDLTVIITIQTMELSQLLSLLPGPWLFLHMTHRTRWKEKDDNTVITILTNISLPCLSFMSSGWVQTELKCVFELWSCSLHLGCKTWAGFIAASILCRDRCCDRCYQVIGRIPWNCTIEQTRKMHASLPPSFACLWIFLVCVCYLYFCTSDL